MGAYESVWDFIKELYNPFESSVLLENMLFFVPNEIIPFIHFFFSVALCASTVGVLINLGARFMKYLL